MYFIYSNIERKICHIPDHTYWEIIYKPFDEDGDSYYNIYLIIDNEEYTIRDTWYWCQGRVHLPDYIVGDFFENIVHKISDMILDNPDIKVIDFDKIEKDLFLPHYKQLWLNNGYIDEEDIGK